MALTADNVVQQAIVSAAYTTLGTALNKIGANNVTIQQDQTWLAMCQNPE